MAKESHPASTDLAVRNSSDVAALDELDAILRTGEYNTEVVDDPEILSKQIIEQLLAAEDDDELEMFGETTPWGELEGVPVEIRGFRWRKSDFEGNAIYLVVFASRMDDGESVTLTTGSLNVVAQMSNLARRGRIPGAVRILSRAARPTKAGYYPMKLVSTEQEKAERKAARQEQRVSAA